MTDNDQEAFYIYQDKNSSIKNCIMHDLPNIYTMPELVEFFMDELLILDGLHYYLTHSEDNIMVFTNLDCFIPFVVMEVFEEQECHVLKGLKAVNNLADVIKFAKAINLAEESDEQIREHVAKEIEKYKSNSSVKLESQFLRRATKFENQKFLLVAYFSKECEEFERILHYLYLIQSENREIYVVVEIEKMTSETLDYIESYFKDNMNFLSDNNDKKITDNFFYQFFMNEIEGHKIIGEGFNLPKMLDDVGKIVLINKIEDVLFIDERIIFFGIPIVLQRLLVNTSNVLLCFKEAYIEEEISVLSEICKYFSVYLLNCKEKVSIHEFGLGENHGIVEKLPDIMGSESKFVFIRSGSAESVTLEQIARESHKSQKILYNEDYFHELFEKYTQTDFIEAFKFRQLANEFPDKTYEIKKGIDLLDRNLLDFEEFKEIFVDAKFFPYEKVVEKEESAESTPSEHIAIKKEKILELLENLKDIIKLEPIVMYVDIKHIVQEIGLEIDANRECFSRSELMNEIEVFKLEYEDEEIELSDVEEPKHDVSMRIQFHAARELFYTLSYGEEKCKEDTIITYLLSNGVDKEVFYKFVEKYKIKLFTFLAFWKIMQQSELKVNLKEVMKSNLKQQVKKRPDEKVDTYFIEYARNLFQSQTKELYMSRYEVSSLLKEYGFKGKIELDKLSFMDFFELIIDENLHEFMLKTDEEKMLKGIFDIYEKENIINKDMIFRIGEIENIRSIKLCEVLSKFPKTTASFEEFYQIMKEAGWRMAW